MCPLIVRAVFCGIPLRTILRTALRLKSCRSRPGNPAASDSYPKKYPSSHRGERIETGVGDLADMNQNKGVLHSGLRPHTNLDDTGRYERNDHRTPERKREKSTVL